MIDTTYAETISEAIISNLDDDGGYDDDQIVAGLVQGIIDVAKRQGGSTANREVLLDEAANLLADGGV